MNASNLSFAEGTCHVMEGEQGCSEASDVLEARRQMAAAGFQHLAMAENFGRTKAA